MMINDKPRCSSLHEVECVDRVGDVSLSIDQTPGAGIVVQALQVHISSWVHQLKLT